MLMGMLKIDELLNLKSFKSVGFINQSKLLAKKDCMMI